MAVQVIDGLLSPKDVGTIVDVWHRYPFYDAIEQQPRWRDDPQLAAERRSEHRSHVGGATETTGDLTGVSPLDLGGRFPGLDGRVDVDRNFKRTIDLSGSSRPDLAWTNYFRANYVYGDRVSVAAIEAFLDHDNFIDAARETFDRRCIVPSIVYANVLLPGQQLPVHTDVPEFMGADRKRLPLWLLVVMHHSALFADRRIAVATTIAYVEGCAGGDFTYYPEPGGPGVCIRPEPGAAVAFDADSTFHAIQPVGGVGIEPPANRSRMRLARDGRRRWKLQRRTQDRAELMGNYASEEVRYSLSWKAYCFSDEAERSAWASGVDPLPLESVIQRLVDELVARDRIPSPDHGLSDVELCRLLIDEFIPFPRLGPAPVVAPSSDGGAGGVGLPTTRTA